MWEYRIVFKDGSTTGWFSIQQIHAMAQGGLGEGKIEKRLK